MTFQHVPIETTSLDWQQLPPNTTSIL